MYNYVRVDRLATVGLSYCIFQLVSLRQQVLRVSSRSSGDHYGRFSTSPPVLRHCQGQDRRSARTLSSGPAIQKWRQTQFPLCRTCADEECVLVCSHTVEQRAFTGTWCTPELRTAMDKGYIVLRRTRSTTGTKRQSTIRPRRKVDCSSPVSTPS